MKAGIVDYGMGNLASVSKALERAGAEARVSADTDELSRAGLIVLPGVGNFAAGMSHIDETGMKDFLVDWTRGGKPLLGICLGMQLLFEESEEGDTKGLGVLPGKVVRFPGPSRPGLKVPHMGWNSIRATGGSQVFQSFSGKQFYFVHSYVCVPSGAGAGAVTDYGGEFVSAVESGRTVGVQFHPEKSSSTGLELLAKILAAFNGAS